jgi:uncharacterized membrane protein
MVLQLKLPAHPTFAALLQEWPTALSYAVSYLLIAIVWINHHFLLRFAKESTPRLILWNFAHMLPASLVPFSTAWVAETRIAAVPAFVYAAVIVLVNLVYCAFVYEVMPRATRRTALTRSLVTLGLFTLAMLLALKLPLVTFALVTCILLTYARPEVPGTAHVSESEGLT